jgi:hypothetical protein
VCKKKKKKKKKVSMCGREKESTRSAVMHRGGDINTSLPLVFSCQLLRLVVPNI